MDRVVLLYVLTFFAVVSAVAVFWGAVSEAAKAKEERMDADRMASMRTEDFGTSIDRLIRKGRLSAFVSRLRPSLRLLRLCR